jgi:hypothetical protein
MPERKRTLAQRAWDCCGRSLTMAWAYFMIRCGLEAEIEARKSANAIIIAEQGRWWTSIIRPLAALPVVIYIWKVVVYDKVLALGSTDHRRRRDLGRCHRHHLFRRAHDREGRAHLQTVTPCRTCSRGAR